MAKQALFHGLVFNEDNEEADLRNIGEEAHYVINDAGFKSHVPAEEIDRAVLRFACTNNRASGTGERQCTKNARSGRPFHQGDG